MTISESVATLIMPLGDDELGTGMAVASVTDNVCVWEPPFSSPSGITEPPFAGSVVVLFDVSAILIIGLHKAVYYYMHARVALVCKIKI